MQPRQRVAAVVIEFDQDDPGGDEPGLAAHSFEDVGRYHCLALHAAALDGRVPPLRGIATALPCFAQERAPNWRATHLATTDRADCQMIFILVACSMCSCRRRGRRFHRRAPHGRRGRRRGLGRRRSGRCWRRRVGAGRCRRGRIRRGVAARRRVGVVATADGQAEAGNRHTNKYRAIHEISPDVTWKCFASCQVDL